LVARTSSYVLAGLGSIWRWRTGTMRRRGTSTGDDAPSAASADRAPDGNACASWTPWVAFCYWGWPGGAAL